VYVRVRAYLISLALLAWVAVPLFRPASADSFPHSTYPMFSHRRPEQLWLNQMVWVSPTGETTALPPRFVGTEEVMQAAATISRAVSSGPSAASSLCDEVARAVAEDTDLSEAVHVEIVSQLYNVIAYFSEGAAPIERRVRARCEVPR